MLISILKSLSKLSSAKKSPARRARVSRTHATLEGLETRQLMTAAVDFLAPTVVDNGGYGIPAQIATGDLNADGRMDVVSVGNWAAFSGAYGSVNVSLGQADGSVKITNNYSAANNRFHSPQLIDLTGDGKLDLLVGDSTGGTVQVLRGQGDGKFVWHSSMSVGRNDSLVVSDFNRDGHMDAAVLSPNGPASRLQILLGNGNGSFRVGQITNLPGDIHTAGSLAVGDVNRDGQPDVLVARPISNSIITMLGRSDGTFQTGSTISMANPGGMALSDLNGDGNVDLAVARPSQNTVAIFQGDGRGSFSTSRELAVGTSPRTVLLSDLNADGFKDVIVANSNSGNVTVWEGRASGGFDGRRDFSAGPSSLGRKLLPTSLALGDFNRDGRMDLVVGHGKSDIIESNQSRQVTILTAAGAVVGNPGRLQFETGSYSVNENAGTATVKVNRTGGSAGTVSVEFITVGWSDRPGYASGGVDFVGQTGRLTFAPGETSKTITVAIIDDQQVEATEKFGVNLYNVGGGAELGTVSYTEVSIIDNDLASRIQFDATSYSVNEGGGTATVRVTRTGGTAGSASVDFTTVNRNQGGYATVGQDYVGQFTRLTFAPGETSKAVSVAIIDDRLVEGSEKLGVVLLNISSGSQLGNAQLAEITIVDNDKPNLKVNDVFLVDVSGNRVNRLAIGMKVFVRVEFNTQDLPAGTNYTLTQTINGVPREFMLNWGAGLAGTGNWTHIWYGFTWTGQQQTVDVSLDAANRIDEAFENDNFRRLIANA